MSEEWPEDPEESMLMDQGLRENDNLRQPARAGGHPGVPAPVSGRRATLMQAWNKARPGTVITTDPNGEGQLVDDARFEALEKGGFFGEYRARADTAEDITGDPVAMGEPHPPTKNEIEYGQKLAAEVPAARRPGSGRLRGRPLNEDGAVEFEKKTEGGA